MHIEQSAHYFSLSLLRNQSGIQEAAGCDRTAERNAFFLPENTHIQIAACV